MSVATAGSAVTLLGLLDARRSTRRLAAGTFTERFFTDLRAAAALTPSAFNSQPWRVVALRERNGAFWDLVEGTIGARLDGDRRERYLARAAGMRGGGMTLLVFEDLARAAPRDGVLPAEARDQAAQGLGMLQLALWLVVRRTGWRPRSSTGTPSSKRRRSPSPACRPRASGWSP